MQQQGLRPGRAVTNLAATSAPLVLQAAQGSCCGSHHINSSPPAVQCTAHFPGLKTLCTKNQLL